MSKVDITKTFIFDVSLTSTVDIIWMSIQFFVSTWDASGKISALCLILIIYFCPNVRALAEVKHALGI